MISSTDAATAESHRGLLADYRMRPGVYDEMLDADGSLRPAWRRLAAALEKLGPEGLNRQADQARRLLRDNGVTYNAYGDEPSPERLWELDCVPLLMSGDEWSALEQGLMQRATLLNLILIDVYGRQDLLKQGALPPELVLGHPGYLLPCAGISVPGDCYLHLYAAHIVRTADGRTYVAADRTQGPSGAGYAVENRIVISRVLAENFHEARVRRLAPFFKTLRESLFAAATRHRENPRVVLLSPGPSSSAYFEDAYLARYLGFTLVEGGDLTVRDNAVYLKTLGGLLPVDVVLRRLHDDDCDPLELRGQTMFGVPGLVQAARSGNVVVANALGSGILESPALAAFLPDLCRRMLGEELQLPSIPTWWCGRDEDRRYVLEHLPQLVIRPAMLHRSRKPIVVERLNPLERERLAEQIRKTPWAYAAQESIERATCPTVVRGSLQPQYAALRTFVTAAGGDRYEVMTGGLLRTAAEPHLLGTSMSAGQGSKDLWVTSDRPVAPVSLLNPPGAAVELRRSSNDLPSRVADNMYWLGRQIERAEGIVRRMRSLISRLITESEPGSMPELAVMLDALPVDWAQVFAAPGDADPHARRREQILRLLYDPARDDSLIGVLRSVHRLAGIVRDRLSMDGFRILNQIDRETMDVVGRVELPMGDALSQLNQLVLLLAAFSGMGMESMTRGPGWRFLDMGRRIERAQHTAYLLHDLLVPAAAEPQPVIEALLEIADSSMTYRSRYLSSLQMAPALDLVMTDESNPRSVAFQLNALAQHVKDLPREDGRPQFSPEQRIMQAVQTDLVCTDVESLCAAVDPQTGDRKQLGELLARLETQLGALSEAITHTYLIHSGKSHRLGRMTVPTEM